MELRRASRSLVAGLLHPARLQWPLQPGPRYDGGALSLVLDVRHGLGCSERRRHGGRRRPAVVVAWDNVSTAASLPRINTRRIDDGRLVFWASKGVVGPEQRAHAGGRRAGERGVAPGPLVCEEGEVGGFHAKSLTMALVLRVAGEFALSPGALLQCCQGACVLSARALAGPSSWAAVEAVVGRAD